jgi:glycosyltransferase involved in cell wall biosynthesis
LEKIVPNLLVVIPALNEEDTVGAVIRATHEALDCDVLVVDDGSSDRTAVVAHAAGAHLVRHPFNLGVGAALRTGFRFAAERGYEAVLQVDADGQHDPHEAARLLAHLDDGSADIVVGSRFAAGYRVGRIRRAAMRLLARTLSRRIGVELTDVTSGFRAFGKSAVQRFSVSYPSAYLSDTVEALLLAADWELRVVEEPVVMGPRMGGQPSAGGPRSALHLVRMVLVIALHKVRRPPVTRGARPHVP